MMTDRPAIAPLFFEADAARILGIRPGALRVERKARRITYRLVAGRVMYRADDLTAWQEAVACRARPQAPSSGRTRSAKASSTSTGPTSEAEAGSVARALAISDQLIKPSRPGSSTAAPNPQHGLAPVVQLRQR
jgi:hypothetical protein